jgi:hypothetical protein
MTKKSKLILIMFFTSLIGFVHADVVNSGNTSELIFDGGDDYNSDLSMEKNDEFSIAFWISPSGDQINNGMIVNKEGTYEIMLTDDNIIRYALSIDGDGDGITDSWATITTDVQLDPNDYQHVVFTYDEGEVKIYKDGELVYDEINPNFDYSPNTLPNGTLTAQNLEELPLYIANRPAAGNIYGSNINISGVGIFDKSLTPEEVQKLYYGDMTLEDLTNSGCIFFAPLINDTMDIINGVNGTLSGDMIALISETGPPNLLNMNLNANGISPLKTPTPLGSIILALISIPIVLVNYLPLRT